MRRPLWNVISLITVNIALAAAILLAIYVHWAIGIVAAIVVPVPMLSR